MCAVCEEQVDGDTSLSGDSLLEEAASDGTLPLNTYIENVFSNVSTVYKPSVSLHCLHTLPC